MCWINEENPCRAGRVHTWVWAYIFGAARPDGEDAFALVLPEANAKAMQVFLDAFSATLGAGEHTVMVLDRAGWHGVKTLNVPANLTLVSLPPYSPQLCTKWTRSGNPMERVWLWLRQRFLSLRVFSDYNAILNACCHPWNAFAGDANRIRSLCLQTFIKKGIL